MIDFYKLPFKDVKKYLRRIYLSLDFIADLELDPKTLKIRAFYQNTSLAPTILVNDKFPINNYLLWNSPEMAPKAEDNDYKNIEMIMNSKNLLIGYKHFDKWKFEDGSEIGTLRSVDQKVPPQELKLQKMIQRKVLGFWQFWALRILRKI